MASSYVGEIRMFANTYIPYGWLACDGQQYPVASYQALYATIGNIYGGNGTTTFAVPNLVDKATMHAGIGAAPGLTLRQLGTQVGSANVTLYIDQIPNHKHNAMAQSLVNANEAVPGTTHNWSALDLGRTAPNYYDNTNPVNMSSQALSPSGLGQPHENRQPFLTVNFAICYDGEIPPRP